MKREYGDLEFKVRGLVVAKRFCNWHMDGSLSTALIMEEERIFCTEPKHFLLNAMHDADLTCDTVLFLSNQFTNEFSRLELHSALLGTSARITRILIARWL